MTSRSEGSKSLRHLLRLRADCFANPSLKRSTNGRPPGPVWRYAVHFRQPGRGVRPLSSAELERLGLT
jgi:hypothetical protein